MRYEMSRLSRGRTIVEVFCSGRGVHSLGYALCELYTSKLRLVSLPVDDVLAGLGIIFIYSTYTCQLFAKNYHIAKALMAGGIRENT